MPSIVLSWKGLTPFSNLKSVQLNNTVEVRERMINYIPLFYVDVNADPCPDPNLTNLFQ